MSAVAVGHHGMTVRDPARTERFFVDVLGFRRAQRVELDRAFSSGVSGVEGATIAVQFLDGPGITVELLRYRGVSTDAVRPSPADPGSAHLALYVAGLDEIVKKAAPLGWRPAGRVMDITVGPRVGGRAVYLTDDDGAVVELVEPPHLRAPRATDQSAD